MPQGGGTTGARGDDQQGESASSQLFLQIRQGTSWSGLEPNNLFLSHGKQLGFTDVSSAVGFDFPDDGRGLTLVDWDEDGDLDSLASNRNAPQLRFLRNDIPQDQNSSIAIHLTGADGVNRDAIGARVTIHLKDAPPIIRTLRAGEGFLAQNTKWLHFGLGDAKSISRVTINWPGGEEQVLTDLSAGGRYRIRHGNPDAELVPPRTLNWPEPLPELPIETKVDGGRAITASRLPVPTLPYETLAGEQAQLGPSTLEGVTLVNLWASWCKPCLLELKEFSEHKADLQRAGIDVLALSLDGVAGQPGTVEAAQAFMDRLESPFDAGIASPETVDKIMILHDQVFEKRSSISLPTSLLLDRRGRLTGIFEGPVSIDELLRHGRKANLEEHQQSLASAIPFEGRWLAAPLGFRLTEYGNVLLDREYLSDAEQLVNTHADALKVDPSQASFLARLGSLIERQGDLPKAIGYYAKAVKLKPDDAQAHVQLGNKLMSVRRYKEAAALFQAALRLDDSLIDARYNRGILLARIGRNDEALKEFQAVVREDTKHALAHANIAAQMMKRKRLGEAIKHLRLTLEVKPELQAVRFQLGRLLEATGQPSEAVLVYKALLERNPQHAGALERIKAIEPTKTAP